MAKLVSYVRAASDAVEIRSCAVVALDLDWRGPVGMRLGASQDNLNGSGSARGERGSRMVDGTVKGSTRDEYVGTGMYDAYISHIPKWRLDSGSGKIFRLREEAIQKLALGLDLQWVVDATPPTAETIKAYFPNITSCRTGKSETAETI